MSKGRSGPHPALADARREEAARRAPALGRSGWRLRWPSWLSQIRLLFLVLVALGVVGALSMGPAGPAFALFQIALFPAVAGVVDALASAYRWRSWRVPWNGMITGLFVALVLPPQGASLSVASPLLLDGALLSAVAILVKHVLRRNGHPVINPAVGAILLGGVVLGIAPAWWGTLGPTVSWGTGATATSLALPIYIVGGLLVNLRTWRRWTLPAAFFVTYGVGVTLQRALSFALIGAPVSAPILLSEMVDPATVFFLLFMVVEPRTAPADPQAWPLYGGFVGAVSAFFAITVPALGAQTTVGPFALLLALALGNLLTLLLRRRSDAARGRSSESAAASRTLRVRARVRVRIGPTRRVRWGWSEGILALTVTVLLLGVAYSVTPPPPTLAAASLTSATLSCAHDNTSIPAGERQSLHYLLGPSVIFWYDNATGRTVFYDPVNNVTVYETDLFEDHGLAEWNGDDSILAVGCHPMTGAQTRGAF